MRIVMAFIAAMLLTILTPGTSRAMPPGGGGTSGAPTIQSVTPVPGGVSIDFTPGAQDGGSPVIRFDANCGADYYGSAVASPVVVLGLSSLSPVTCTVWGVNAAGAGPQSASSPMVSPLDPVNTAILVYSQPGDYVGQGRDHDLRVATGYRFRARTLYGEALEFNALSESTGWTSWGFTFRGPDRTPLAPGMYLEAQRWPFEQPGHPGIDYSGDGRGCNSQAGRFNVLAITRDVGGNVTSAAIDFEQHCEGQVPAAFGQIRYNSTVPIDTAKRIIHPVTIPPVVNAAPGSLQTSAPVTLTGINVPVPISITGGEFSVNNGPFITGSSYIINNTQVRVRTVAASNPNALVTAVLHVGAVNVPFRVGTTPGDAPQPNGENFISIVSMSPPGQATTRVLSAATMDHLSLDAWIQPSQPREIRLRARAIDGGWREATFWLGGPDGNLPQPGTYNDVISQREPGNARMYWNAYQIPYCNDHPVRPVSRVVVHEAEYSAADQPIRLAADVIMDCADGYGPRLLYLYIRFNSTVPVDYARRQPVPFKFPAIYNAPLSTPQVSATAIVGGMTEPVPVSVVGGEYSIDGAAFTTAPGSIASGQAIRVRLTSAATPNALRIATLTLGGFSTAFRVGTAPGADPQPGTEPLVVFIAHPRSRNSPVERHVFSPATGANVSFNEAWSAGGTRVDMRTASYPSPVVEFSGPGTALLSAGVFPDAAISSYDETRPSLSVQDLSCDPNAELPRQLVVHEATYDAGGKPLSLAADMIVPCQQYGSGPVRLYGYVRLNSQVPIDYTIRRPAPLTFDDVRNASLSALVESAPEMVRGITVPVAISITGGEYSIDGAPFTAAPGTVTAGQLVRVRLTASASSNTMTAATLTVGEGQAQFRVGTAAGIEPQPNGTPLIVLRAQSASDGALVDSVLSEATSYELSLPPPDYYPTSFRASRMSVHGYPESWVAYPHGPGHAPITPGTYSNYPGDPGIQAPGIGGSNWIYELPACYMGRRTSRTVYTVHEIERSVTGQVLRLALDFRCTLNDEHSRVLHGYVRIGSSVPIDYAVRTPLPLEFPPVAGVAPGSTVLSAVSTIRGINVAVPITVSGGEYRLDDGPFTMAPGMVTAGQRVQVRAVAAAGENRLVTVTVTTGETTSTFRVGTATGTHPQPDDEFTLVLISQGNEPVLRGRTEVASPATLARITQHHARAYEASLTIELPPLPGSIWTRTRYVGFSAPAGGNLVPGPYTGVNSGTNGNPPRMGIQGDGSCSTPTGEFTVHEFAQSGDQLTRLAVDFVQTCEGSGPLHGYLRVNSTVPITQIVDSAPTPFQFPPRYGVPRGKPVESAAVTLQGFNAAAPVSVAGGEYSLDGGAFTTAPGVVLPGQEIRARVTSHPAFAGSASATVTVGGVQAEFRVESEYSDNAPDPLSFPTVRGVAEGTWVVSAVRTPTGFNVPATVSITNGEMSVAGRPFVTGSATLLPGETVQVRVMSGSGAGTARTAYLVLGPHFATFTAVTLRAYTLTLAIQGPGTVGTSHAALSCPGACSALLSEGTVVALTGNPSAGRVFAGWQGGGCSGTAGCTVTLDQATTVTATFTDGLPGAPMLTAAVPGDARAMLAFQAPAGGATSYTATCQPGNVTASGSTSPISVTGLANGTEYTCRVRATTAQGAGPDSNALTVTPAAAAPLAVVAAVSRKTHAGVGDLDIPLNAAPATGAITVDPRWSANGHLIVFQVNAAVTAVGAVTLVDHLGAAVGNASVTFNGNDVLVSLIGVPDARRLTVSVAGVNGTLPVSVSLGVLVGDVNGSGTVDASDTAALRGQVGQAVRADNAGFDVNASGGISAGDVATVKARAGRSLP